MTKTAKIREGTTGCLPSSFSNAFKAQTPPKIEANGATSKRYLGQAPAKQ